MVDDLQDKVRGIIERPIAELVAIGLEGGRQAALRMLARQYIIRMSLDDDGEGLLEMRKEIDDAITPASDEAVH